MQTVKTKFDLKRATEDIVMVKSVNIIFKRQDGEWIAKTKFNTDEVSEELNIPYPTINEWLRKLNIQKRKFDLDDIRMIIFVKKMRANKISLKEIKKMICQ